MDIIEQYARSNMLSRENVLSLVDEYTLYVFYLGFELEIGNRYNSPIRSKDSNPSFAIFPSNNKYYDYLWKDFGYNESGSIVKLLRLMFDLKSADEVFRLIDRDFDLGLVKGSPIETKIVNYDRPSHKEECSIRVIKRDWNQKDKIYWEEQGISFDHIKKKERYIFPISHFWTKDSQPTPFTPMGLCYTFQIGPYYKIYQPDGGEFKFINNYPSNYIEGFTQLDYSNNDLLIITKSRKEVEWFKDNLNIESICAKSESMMIPKEFIDYLTPRFKKIIVFLDPDAAGYKQAYNYQAIYGFKWYTILPCHFTFAKDPTDHNKLYGDTPTINLIKLILHDVLSKNV
jgi:hypothetical protein